MSEERESQRLTRESLEKLEEIEHALNTRIDEQVQLLEQRIDSQEELVANLMMAYTELAASVETTIEEIMSPRDEKEKEEFRNNLNKRHAQVLKMIQEVANEVGDSSRENSGQTLLNMATKQQADRPNTKRDDSPSN